MPSLCWIFFPLVLQVDPMGDRTVGVLTKLDLVGRGSEDEVVQVLENVRKPLQLGYVGIKCRSQAGLKDNQSLEDARTDETTFFATHPVFKRLPADLVGVETLTTKLTRVLVSRIREAVPAMADDISAQLKETDGALKGLGGSPPATRGEQQKVYVERVGVFLGVLRAAVRGQYDDPAYFSDASYRLCTAARKSFDICSGRITKDLRPAFEHDDYLATIKLLVEKSRGRELPCFPSMPVFNSLVKTTAGEWAEPAADCREAVVDELRLVVNRLAERTFGKYPNLTAFVVGLAAELVDEVGATCAATLEQLLSFEDAPLTTNPAFMAAVNKRRKSLFGRLTAALKAKEIGDESSESHMGSKEDDERSESHKDAVDVGSLSSPQELLTALEAYWQVASLRFSDNVAMAVQSMLEVGYARIDTELYTRLADADMATLFAEDGGLRGRRMGLEAKRTRLRQARAAMRNLNGM